MYVLYFVESALKNLAGTQSDVHKAITSLLKYAPDRKGGGSRRAHPWCWMLSFDLNSHLTIIAIDVFMHFCISLSDARCVIVFVAALYFLIEGLCTACHLHFSLFLYVFSGWPLVWNTSKCWGIWKKSRKNFVRGNFCYSFVAIPGFGSILMLWFHRWQCTLARKYR